MFLKTFVSRNSYIREAYTIFCGTNESLGINREHLELWDAIIDPIEVRWKTACYNFRDVLFLFSMIQISFDQNDFVLMKKPMLNSWFRNYDEINGYSLNHKINDGSRASGPNLLTAHSRHIVKNVCTTEHACVSERSRELAIEVKNF